MLNYAMLVGPQAVHIMPPLRTPHADAYMGTCSRMSLRLRLAHTTTTTTSNIPRKPKQNLRNTTAETFANWDRCDEDDVDVLEHHLQKPTPPPVVAL
jgi:hypothetical protein